MVDSIYRRRREYSQSDCFFWLPDSYGLWPVQCPSRYGGDESSLGALGHHVTEFGDALRDSIRSIVELKRGR